MNRKLFEKMTIRDLEFRNRIFVSPMCQYSSLDGMPTDWHMVHLGSRAVGGAGLVMAEATAVSPEGRISAQDAGIWNADQAAAYRRIAEFIREQGAVPGIQLAHAGRKASTEVPWRGGSPLFEGNAGWQTLAPSPIPFATGHPEPRELTETDIRNLVDCFVEAAKRAQAASFEVVEIHMAHGYLLHEFLSPLSNHRTDAYGGNIDGRIRFPLQVAEAVRNVWPQPLPVFVRVSATDWKEGGWNLDQSVYLCRKLKALDIDLIDTSSGGLVPDALIPASSGFQVPFSATIRQETGMLTGAVGLITSPEQAEQVLVCGQADVVFLGRELLRDPYWPLRAAKTLNVEFPCPVQYERAW